MATEPAKTYVFFDFTGTAVHPSKVEQMKAAGITLFRGVRLTRVLSVGSVKTIVRVLKEVHELPIDVVLDNDDVKHLFKVDETRAKFVETLERIHPEPRQQVIDAMLKLKKMSGVEVVIISNLPSDVLHSWMRDADIDQAGFRVVTGRQSTRGSATWTGGRPASKAPPSRRYCGRNRRSVRMSTPCLSKTRAVRGWDSSSTFENWGSRRLRSFWGAR